MVLDVLAFSAAAVALAAVVAMLAIGLSDLSNPPTTTVCRRCSRWMIDTRHQPEPLCSRCRERHVPIPGFDITVRRKEQHHAPQR
ncbi:hypothetical protein [Nocardia sp. NPDC020380]|uniref:hypothetical protein n=1 Tax=Nocardia sp. NPDC020380 TaxID=3364309 RepID=UPI0037B13DC8